jgi:hypothetical protein
MEKGPTALSAASNAASPWCDTAGSAGFVFISDWLARCEVIVGSANHAMIFANGCALQNPATPV